MPLNPHQSDFARRLYKFLWSPVARLSDSAARFTTPSGCTFKVSIADDGRDWGYAVICINHRDAWPMFSTLQAVVAHVADHNDERLNDGT